MKGIVNTLKESLVEENHQEDLTYKAFGSYYTEDDFSGAGEIFGELFKNSLGSSLSEFIYGVGESCRDNTKFYNFLNKVRMDIEKNLN